MIQRHAFARPALDTGGDSTARDVFVSVGYALSQWEHTEEMLASLYAYLASPARHTHAAFRSYGTLTATRQRRSMIEAAAETFFLNFQNDDLSGRLKALLAVYGDAGARRNEIAHGVVMGRQETAVVNGKVELVRTSWFLVPALHSTNKTNNRLEAEYRFSSATIDRFTQCFDHLHTDITEIKRDITTFYQSLPETVRAQY